MVNKEFLKLVEEIFKYDYEIIICDNSIRLLHNECSFLIYNHEYHNNENNKSLWYIAYPGFHGFSIKKGYEKNILIDFRDIQIPRFILYEKTRREIINYLNIIRTDDGVISLVRDDEINKLL